MEDDDEVAQQSENKRITRYRGKKHVPVYTLNLEEQRGKLENICDQDMENVKLKSQKSIINCKDYSREPNFSPQLVRAEGKSAFYSRKRALASHALMCEEAFCQICNLAQKVKAFQYVPSNLSRYNETLKCSPRFQNSTKKVKFAISDGFEKSDGFAKSDEFLIYDRKKLDLNLASLFQACEHNISFKELTLLQ